MRAGNGEYLIRRWHESNTVLSGAYARMILLTNTAQATCIAYGRGWEGSFPAAHEEVPRSGAAKCEGAFPEMLYKSVVRFLCHAFAGVFFNFLQVKMAKVLSLVRIYSITCCDEAVIVPTHRRISKQWKNLCPR